MAKGSAGQCTLGMDAAGKVVNFSFGAVEADYPGLGGGFYVSDGPATIKWLAGTGYLTIAGGQDVGVMAITPDHKSIALDTSLDGNPGTEHVTGSIVCP